MKKIAIITITEGSNYGNRLQNFAAQSILKNLKFNVETLYNYYGKLSKFKFTYKKIKRLCKYQISPHILEKFINSNDKIYFELKRNKAFEDFNKKYIKFSKFEVSGNSISLKLNSYYDYFICGSDQIWNPYYSESAYLYFLMFADHNKTIAFSPSMGISDFPQKMKINYIKWINHIKFLSVREKSGSKIIKNLTGRGAPVLVDPTLLLNKSDWLKISKVPKCKPKGKYILTYFLGEKLAENTDRINYIASKNNLVVFNLLDENDINKYSIDPSEFIDLIKDASLVCTDSFHGIVFSIIMKVPFIVFERKGKEVSMNSRIETLLNLFNLNSRLCGNVDLDNNLFYINYEGIDAIIEKEKLKSISYLKKALL